jgi:hypothetical protein
MRRALVAGLAILVTAMAGTAVAGCASEAGLASPGRTGSVRLSVTPTRTPADPRLTRQICAAAVRGTGEVLKMFNEQLATLERAAARGDQSTMVEAAEVIIEQVVEMATALRVFAQKAVTPRVRAALSRASAKLAEIATESYAGSPTDIRTTLTGLGTALTKACG